MTRRPGYVLVVVLMVIVVLSLSAYRFADAMTAEMQAAYAAAEAAQVKAFAVSGLHYAMGATADPDLVANSMSGDPTIDNPSFFANVAVGPAKGGRGAGRFAVVGLGDAADGSGGYPVKYALTDEGGKLNLNSMMRIDSTGLTLRSMLLLIPNMTEEAADGIVDWLDADDDQQANGGENSYYQGLDPPYACKNGPLNSLDELLMVKGVTPELLYGTDRNRNGRQDPGEAIDGTFSRGWADYLTIYGRELNVDSTGAPRVYCNGTDMAAINQQLAGSVGQALADYVVAYRMYSRSSTTQAAPSGSVTASADELRTEVQKSLGSNARSQRTIPNTLLSLRNTRVTLPALPTPERQPGQPAPMTPPTRVFPCPLNDDATFKAVLVALLDKTTCKSSYELNPRININTCPRELLAALPAVTPPDVDAAVAARESLTPGSPEHATGAWLVTQAGMQPALFQQLAAIVTGTSMTYRAQAIGYFERGGPVARAEAVFDTNLGQPRFLYFRELTDLGGGFPPPR